MTACGTCSGKFDKRVTLQSNTPSQDGYGQPVESWSTIATVWAEKLTARQAERFTGVRHAGFDSITWRIRYRTGLDNLDRLVWNGQNYDIEGTDIQGRNESILLTTKAVIDK